jgi:DNA invertase Pin-like site-specific DNA recombinase
MMKRAVMYLRVSTHDQTTVNQERELRAIAGRMGVGRPCFRRTRLHHAFIP